MKVRSSAFCNATGKAWQSSFLERFHFNQREDYNAHTYTGWGECALISQRGVTKI